MPTKAFNVGLKPDTTSKLTTIAMPLPSSLDLAALNGLPHITYTPNPLSLVKGIPGPGVTEHVSASLPLKIGGASRSVIGRGARSYTRSRTTNKGKTRTTTHSLSMPVQLNEASANLEEAESGNVSISLQVTRDLGLDPATMLAILNAFLATGYMSTALKTAVCNDDLA